MNDIKNATMNEELEKLVQGYKGKAIEISWKVIGESNAFNVIILKDVEVSLNENGLVINSHSEHGENEIIYKYNQIKDLVVDISNTFNKGTTTIHTEFTYVGSKYSIINFN
jgi:hypothetical protein